MAAVSRSHCSGGTGQPPKRSTGPAYAAGPSKHTFMMAARSYPCAVPRSRVRFGNNREPRYSDVRCQQMAYTAGSVPDAMRGALLAPGSTDRNRGPDQHSHEIDLDPRLSRMLAVEFPELIERYEELRALYGVINRLTALRRAQGLTQRSSPNASAAPKASSARSS